MVYVFTVSFDVKSLEKLEKLLKKKKNFNRSEIMRECVSFCLENEEFINLHK